MHSILPKTLSFIVAAIVSTATTSVERETTMTTTDGTKLVADIYHPKNRNQQSPTILVRIPFSKSAKNRFREDLVGRVWADNGYTVVVQGTRGRFGSEGKFYPLVGEREDGIDTLKWIARQPWYNGQIATWGGSASGHTQWAIADQANPGPSACQIYFASTNFHDALYPGGAFALSSALSWAVVSHGKEDLPAWPSARDITRGATGNPMVDADVRSVGAEISFFRDWASHQKRDEYWVRVDGVNRNQRLKAPALLMGGWYDAFLPTQLDDFVAIKKAGAADVARRTRIIIGPWGHAREIKFADGSTSEKFRPKSLEVSLPFFNETIKSAAATEPPVRIFVMGINKWRSEQEWPLARTKYTSFYLHASAAANGIGGDGRLSLSAPEGAEPDDSYTYDPRNPVPTSGGAMLGTGAGVAKQNAIEKRKDVLVYSTESLPKDVEVTGPVELELFASTTAKSTDFTAKLVDVHPNGDAFNVCDGILRRCYEPVLGGAQASPQKIRVKLWPTSMVFRKGHKIRLEVSSSNFPRFDVNLNIGGDNARASHPVTAVQTISHSRLYPSRLILPLQP